MPNNLPTNNDIHIVAMLFILTNIYQALNIYLVAKC